MAAAGIVDLGVGCAFIDPFVAGTLNNPDVGIRKLTPHITHSYSILLPQTRQLVKKFAIFWNV